MGNFKDFDLDLKVSKADRNGDTTSITGVVCELSIKHCPSIAEPCDSTPAVSCMASCECISPSDMTACSACGQVAEKNDIRRC